jgi:hypothetical protein
MGKRKRLTYIEILLILAIIAVLVVWLFPRLLKTLDFNSSRIGIVIPYIGDASGIGGLNKLGSYCREKNFIMGNYFPKNKGY